MIPRARRSGPALAGLLGALLLPGVAARAEPPAPPGQDEQDAAAKRQEARAYFEKGVALHDERRWDEALAELQQSRRSSPNRAATKYAASCLRELGRFDEALDMFEEVRAFPNLSAADLRFAEAGIAELEPRMGTLAVEGGEPGASLVIDGRYRGTLPLRGPARVIAGSHEVRAFKEGLDPFGATIEVRAGQAAVVLLRSLSTGGRLKVSEQRGRVLDVLVDGTVAGKTPWEGPLTVGEHLVTLRGSVDLAAVPECTPDEGAAAGPGAAPRGNVELGTQPVSVPIRLREVTRLTLTAEVLDASLRVEPTPGGAVVSIDSVVVGRGAWEGRLRAGEHHVEVSADGFLSETRRVTLERRKRQVMTLALARDRSTASFRTTRNTAAGTAFVVGTAGLGVGAVAGLQALVRIHDVNARCLGTSCPLSEQANADAASTLGTVSTVGLVLGGIGVATGTIVLVALRPGGSARSTGASAGTVGVGLGGFNVEGRF
jgi:hypothetical protein